MKLGTQLSMISVSLVLVPGLLLGGICAYLMLHLADTSASVVREGLRQDAERSLAIGVQRERDFVQDIIAQASADAVNLASSSQVPVALDAADATNSPAMHAAMAEIGRGAIDTVAQFQAQADILQKLLERNLQLATLAVARAGMPQLGDACVRPITNQVTKVVAPMAVPKVLFGTLELAWVEAGDTPAPIVDEIARQIGGLCTIFVRTSDGSMVRAATNVMRGSQRAIGTCIPAVEAEGKPGPVLKAVMAGQAYNGLAKVVDQWCLTAYQPLKAVDGAIIGMLFVGLRINDIPTLADTVLRRTFGKTGYAYAIDASGRVVIHPRKELVGKHLIDDLKLAALAPVLGPAEPGVVSRIDYEFDGRAKFASWTRMPGWNWTFMATGNTGEIAGDFAAAALSLHRGEIENVFRGATADVNGQRRNRYTQIRLLDAAGRERINYQNGRHADELKDKSDTTWFKAAKANANGKLYIHRPEVAVNTGRPELRFVVPVQVNGMLRGYTVLSLDWSIINDALVAHRYGKTGYPWIIDDAGVFVAHPKFSLKEGEKATDAKYGPLAALAQNRLLAGETGIGNYPWQGGDKYVAFTPLVIGTSRCCVAASVPAIEFLELADKLGVEGRAEAMSSIPIMGAVVIVIALIGAGIGLWSALRLTRPLRALSQLMGNGATQVSSAAGQVSDSSQRLSQGASSQASSLEETSASLEQLTANTRQNADNARQADVLAQEANRTALQGEGEARRIAGEVAGHLAQLGEAVAAIRTSTEQTKQVVETIDEIAFQTNLLALNAAVEAARAGEAGMGFAVVADEVRNLAQRSTEEVRNTTALMKQAQAATTRVMEVTGIVEGYLKQAVGEQMVASFKQVVDGTGKVTHLMAEVSTASDEQAKGVEQINRAIAEMDKVTQENAASAEESAAASEELNSQAAEMQNSVLELTRLVEGAHGDGAVVAPSNGVPARPHAMTHATSSLPLRTTASLRPVPPKRTTQIVPSADRSTRRASEILPLTDAEQQSDQGDGTKR